MRRSLWLLVTAALLAAFSPAAAQRTHVRGYTRKDGSYVAPHPRRTPSLSVPRSATPRSYTTPRPRPPHAAPRVRPAPRVRSAPGPATGARDGRGRLRRSEDAKRDFMKQTGHPRGWPGHVVDHRIPLACGGADAPSNMQWQSAAEAKAKDKVERQGCGKH